MENVTVQENKPYRVCSTKKDVGKRLRAARESANLSRDEVVAMEDVDVSRTTLQQWEVGAREASIEKIFCLASIYKVDPLEIISGIAQTRPSIDSCANKDIIEFVEIPAYDIEVSAGHGMFSEGAYGAQKHLAFRKRWIKARGLDAKQLAVLFTKGDSMTPTIPENAAIVIDMLRNQAMDGKVYVIRVDDRLYVKRTQWLINGGLRLISDNKFYDALDITKDDMVAGSIEICGQVIHASYDLPD